MKNIKTYEDYEKLENLQWRVRLEQPYFELSLHKIGMMEDEIKTYMNHFNDLKEEYHDCTHLYFGLEFDDGTIGASVFHNKYRFNKTFKFMGDVEDQITPEEIADWKYQNDVKKYNL